MEFDADEAASDGKVRTVATTLKRSRLSEGAFAWWQAGDYHRPLVGSD